MQQDYENVMECYDEMSEEGRKEFDKILKNMRGEYYKAYLNHNRLSKAKPQFGRKTSVELIGALMREGFL